jgi:hypothetical protein
LPVEISWWERFLAQFEAKPILIGSYSVLVCGGLLLGLSLFQMMDADVNSLSAANPAERWSAAARSAVPVPNRSALTHAVNLPDSPLNSHDHSALLAEPPPISLFDGSAVKVERASFRFDGN